LRPADTARLLLLAALWGASFLFIRIAAPVLGPITLIAARVTLAGLVLLLYALATHRELAIRRYWREYLVIGAINSALPFVLISTASLRLPASLAAILNATTPLFGAVFAYLWLDEPLTRRKIGGLVLGFGGVAVLAGWGPLAPTRAVMLSACASLLGAASYGLASVYTKAKASGAPLFGMATVSQLAAAVLLLPITPFAPPYSQPTAGIILAVSVLAVFCTALAYLLYFRLVLDVGPLRAITVTFLVPIFATVWGALFLKESVTASMILGCALILGGTALILNLHSAGTALLSVSSRGGRSH